MPADSTHHSAPAATADDILAAATKVREAGRAESFACQPTEDLADRLESLASLLPALLAVADAAVTYCGPTPPGAFAVSVGPLFEAVRAYQEATE